MRFSIVLLMLAFVACAMSMPANDWNLEMCEAAAAKARRESTVCQDYQCVEYSYGMAVTGVNCIGNYS